MNFDTSIIGLVVGFTAVALVMAATAMRAIRNMVAVLHEDNVATRLALLDGDELRALEVERRAKLLVSADKTRRGAAERIGADLIDENRTTALTLKEADETITRKVEQEDRS